ncbi:hypothetical protein BDV93DRAFT_521621 [Ceratobasidium sp. AG-I]|nr:hypothetical protein BDV93DRAFT_521621 [Ceratobasidium sp. AG-I]
MPRPTLLLRALQVSGTGLLRVATTSSLTMVSFCGTTTSMTVLRNHHLRLTHWWTISMHYQFKSLMARPLSENLAPDLLAHNPYPLASVPSRLRNHPSHRNQESGRNLLVGNLGRVASEDPPIELNRATSHSPCLQSLHAKARVRARVKQSQDPGLGRHHPNLRENGLRKRRRLS